jgi:tetratricopeptide (TPR) repeat protein
MLKKRIFTLLLLVLILFIGYFFAALHESKRLHRDPRVLVARYFQLKTINPVAAKQALLLALKEDPHYLPALNAYQALLPSSREPAVVVHVEPDTIQRLDQAPTYAAVNTNPYHAVPAKPGSNAQSDQNSPSGMNPRLRGNDNHKDFPIRKAPLSLKQQGYTALSEGHRMDAILIFTRAYAQTHDPDVAMQLGYLYDEIQNKPKAYEYFKLATHSPNKAQALCAEQALTNLSGLQLKALPTPYYAEVLFNPFSETRFGLTVRPLIVRAGVEQANTLQTKEYVFFRRSDDNRSENYGQLTQLYEDNVQITGVGAQVQPFKKLPVVGFIEAGAAYDLVYRAREPWRGDLRVGMMYYQDFGARPGFYDKLTLGHQYYSDVYADTTYFSRYRNNVIGGIRTRQGIRLLQYKSSLLNVYMVGRVLGDTRREYFNNIAEIGPGIAFIPSNRVNLQVRLEHVNGAYLPAGALTNPYRPYYTNTIIQLFFYVKI